VINTPQKKEVADMVEVELPDVGKINVDRVVDCQGMVCPRPQLEVKRAATQMKEGEVAEVLITNPASVEAIPGILKKTGCTLLGKVKEGNVFKLYFKKGT